MGPDGSASFNAGEPKAAYNATENEYLVVWHGDDDSGRRVSPGIYFIRLDTGKEALNHRVVLVK